MGPKTWTPGIGPSFRTLRRVASEAGLFLIVNIHQCAERKLQMTNVVKLETFDYAPHPLAAMFPMIEGREFEDLKDSVRHNGVLVQIVQHPAMSG